MKIYQSLVIILIISAVFANSKINTQKIFEQLRENKTADYEVDINTHCNYKDLTVQNYQFNLDLDFEKSVITGEVNYSFFSYVELNSIILDVWHLDIKKVFFSSAGHSIPEKSVSWNLNEKPNSKQGESVEIILDSAWTGDEPIPAAKTFDIRIEYNTKEEGVGKYPGYTFATAEQTDGDTPFFYTQNEPIYLRTWMPSCDTPTIKSTWKGQITVPKGLSVYMSGELYDATETTSSTTYFFNSRAHLTPMYYLGFIAGKFILEPISDRVNIIAEPHVIDDAMAHFGTEIEEWLKYAEEWTGVEYKWDKFQLVVMPLNYPFEGSAHPSLSYVSPTILEAGDIGKTVIMHQIASAYFGNMLSCANWRNVWLNEGFATFLERKISEHFFSVLFSRLDRIDGDFNMIEEMKDMQQGEMDTFASLYPDTTDQNPDEAFTLVPMEKGYQFLVYIEDILSESEMQDLLKSWVENDQFRPTVWEDFRDFFIDYLKMYNPDKLQDGEAVDWDLWVKQPGPVDDKIQKFSSQAYDIVADLADKFVQFDGTSQPQDWQDLLQWDELGKAVFIDYFRGDKYMVNQRLMKQLDNSYDFGSSTDPEVKSRWYALTAEMKYKTYENDEGMKEFLSKCGRLRHIIPIYEGLIESGRTKTAENYLTQNTDFYHPIAIDIIKKLLYGEDYEN